MKHRHGLNLTYYCYNFDSFIIVHLIFTMMSESDRSLLTGISLRRLASSEELYILVAWCCIGGSSKENKNCKRLSQIL